MSSWANSWLMGWWWFMLRKEKKRHPRWKQEFSHSLVCLLPINAMALGVWACSAINRSCMANWECQPAREVYLRQAHAKGRIVDRSAAIAYELNESAFEEMFCAMIGAVGSDFTTERSTTDGHYACLHAAERRELLP